MKNKKLLIYGIGETAEIAFEYFTHDSEYDVIAFVVDKKFIKKNKMFNIPIISFEKVEQIYPPSQYFMFAAATYNQLNRVRSLMYKKAKEKKYKMASYVSSNAFVWHNVIIGDNVMIFENNVIQSNVKIGNNVILWSGNHIGHRSIIEDHVYISSHCVVSGFCTIKKYSFLGVNCTFNDGITLAEDNLVASGALISKDSTKKGNLLIGSPARVAPHSSYKAFDVNTDLL
jgi:sugar O-acyltransferase (sialic acid O-acetyltransferase NeuD family)